MGNARRADRSKMLPQPQPQPIPISSPGVLILSMTLQPLYITPNAHRFLAELDGVTDAWWGGRVLPPAVRHVCTELQQDGKPYPAGTNRDKMQVRHLAQTPQGTILVRGYCIVEQHGGQTGRFLILLEALPAESSGHDSHEEMECQFTARQRGILNGLVLGLTNKEIAESMTISVHTVKEYVRQLMMKLHTGSRTGIVARVAGLTLPSPKATGQFRPHGIPTAVQDE